MALAEQLEQDLKEAMRQRDVVRREAVRSLLSALRYEELAKARPLSE